MKRRKPFLLIAASTLTLLTGIAAGVWASLHAGSRTVRLADGSLLTLERVGYDGAPELVLGPLWQRRLYPLVPAHLRNRLGWSFIDCPPEWSKGALTASVLHLAPRPHDSTGVVIDRHGCEFRSTSWGNLNERMSWNIQCFPFFPRREGSFRHRVSLHRGNGGPEPVAEWTLANPVPGAYPVWEPEPFPVTKRAGDTAFTLLDFTTGIADRWGVSRLRARYRVTQTGAPAPEWRPVSAHLSDAMGGARQYEHLRRPGTGTFELGGAVCRQETYRLRVEFSRYEDADARPDAVWTARGVPLRRAVTVRPGITLVIEPSNIVMGSITAPKPGLRFRLRGIDQNGRPFRFAPARWGSSTRQAFVLKLDRDARLLDVQVEVFRSRFAEFTVKPTGAPAGPSRRSP